MKQVCIVFYDQEGRILGIRTTIESRAEFLMENDGLLKIMGQKVKKRKSIVVHFDRVRDIQDHFVNKRGELDNKTKLTSLVFQDSVEVGQMMRVDRIPTGSLVTWPDGYTELVNDGFAESEAIFEGMNIFTVDHPHHYPVEVVINATA